LLAPEYYDYRNKCMGDREKRFYINGARVIFVHAPFVVNIIKDQPCDLCTENPGVCTYCQGSGKRTWETTIETCNVCNGAKKCQDCKGTLRKDKKMHCECKDWGRVLRDLLEE